MVKISSIFLAFLENTNFKSCSMKTMYYLKFISSIKTKCDMIVFHLRVLCINSMKQKILSVIRKSSNRFRIIGCWSVLRWSNNFWNIYHYSQTAGEFSSYRFLVKYFYHLDFLFEFCFRYNKQCMGMECDCEVVPKGLQGCGETCLNRQLLMECPPTCNNSKCSNKRFQVG